MVWLVVGKELIATLEETVVAAQFGVKEGLRAIKLAHFEAKSVHI